MRLQGFLNGTGKACLLCSDAFLRLFNTIALQFSILQLVVGAEVTLYRQ